MLPSPTENQDEHRHSYNATMPQLFRAWSELVHDCTKHMCPKSAPGSVLQRISHICLGELEQNRSQNNTELNIPKFWQVQMNLPSLEIPKPTFCEFWIWRSSQSCTSWLGHIFNIQKKNMPALKAVFVLHDCLSDFRTSVMTKDMVVTDLTSPSRGVFLPTCFFGRQLFSSCFWGLQFWS